MISNSGTRKSSVINKLSAPHKEYEKFCNDNSDHLQSNLVEQENEAITNDLIKQHRRQLIKEININNVDEFKYEIEQHNSQAAKLKAENQENKRNLRTSTDIFFTSGTPLRLAKNAEQNSGSVAILADEAEFILDVVKNTNKRTDYLDFICHGYDNDSHKYLTTRDYINVSKLAFNMLIFAQSLPFNEFAKNKYVVGRGILGRISVIYTRLLNEEHRIPTDDYHKFIASYNLQIFNFHKRYHDSTNKHITLELSQEAKMVFNDFENMLKLQKKQMTGNLEKYISKHAARVLRYAGITHMLNNKYQSLDEAESTPINYMEMWCGRHIAEYLLEHAKYIYGQYGLPAIDKIRRSLNWIRNTYTTENQIFYFTMREFCQGALKKKEFAIPILDIMGQMRLIKCLTIDRYTVYVVNPVIFEPAFDPETLLK
jgi:hypothetical protein